MIVVVGAPAWREVEPAGPAGRTCEIALAAAANGAGVELVGRIGDDRAGDSLLIAMARAGVGHAAVLRDPIRPTAAVRLDPEPVDVPMLDAPGTMSETRSAGPRLEPADVALGLSYLTAFAVLVVADDAPQDVLPACIEGAAFAGARLVALVPADRALPRELPGGLPADATLLAAPDEADDGAFATLVGAYAAALDAGEDPAAAFRSAAGVAGWTEAGAGEPA